MSADAIVEETARNRRCPVAVVDHDPLDPTLSTPDPATGGTTELFWSKARELQDTGPVLWTDANGGHWIVTRHEDIVAVSKDWQTFSSASGVGPVPFGHAEASTFRLAPLEADPPYQRDVRKLLTPLLSPSAVRAMEEQARTLVNELIDGFAACGTCELIGEFATPLPGRFFFENLCGLKVSELGKTMQLVDRVMRFPETTPEIIGELLPWCMEVCQQRLDRPRQRDIIDVLVFGEVDGERLTPHQQLEILVMLIMGGLETTAIAVGNLMRVVALDAELRDHLRSGAADLGLVVEELLRWEMPAPASARTATRDVELAGAQIRKGDRVLLYWGLGNRDPRVWDDPDSIDLTRDARSHTLTFADGPHFCLGAHVARLELRVALEELLRRLPDLHVQPGHQLEWRLAITRGPKALPLAFTPEVTRG